MSASESEPAGAESLSPLAGVDVLEFQAQGPVPFATTVLASMGANVTLIERIPDRGATEPERMGFDPTKEAFRRNRRSIALDLKRPDGVNVAKRLAAGHHVVIEGFRPGVMERLGLGPDDLFGANPQLVYVRATGWGQTGTKNQTAGHDINYLAETGVLATIGHHDAVPPAIPPAYVGDFGAGGTMVLAGVLGGLLRVHRSGHGAVVDAAMADGLALMATMWLGRREMGLWEFARGANVSDGGAPFYRSYRCSDGQYLAVGAIESRFYKDLLKVMDLPGNLADSQYDRRKWASVTQLFVERFAERPRAQWLNLAEGSDACMSPVIYPPEAAAGSYSRSRDMHVEVDGATQARGGPRFSGANCHRTLTPTAPPAVGRDTIALLREAQIGEQQIRSLVSSQTVYQAGI